MKILSFVATILLISLAAGADQAQDWSDLVGRVVTEGEQAQNNLFQTRSLSLIEPNDVTKSRVANYITAAGKPDPSGLFAVEQVALTQETWTLNPNGDWYIEQWFAYVTSRGVVMEIAHQAITKTAAGSNILTRLDPGTPEEQSAKWNELISVWIK